jgi:hypothetical protein
MNDVCLLTEIHGIGREAIALFAVWNSAQNGAPEREITRR